MLEEILEKIKEFDTIIIHRHMRPDGDAIGTQMGLKHFIIDNFKDKKVYSVGEKAPDYIDYIAEYDEISDDIYQNALVIVVDTSNAERISDERWKTGKFIIKIDHHDDSPDFGNINYVEPRTPACAAVVTKIIQSWEGFTISKEAAYCFLFGIVTDTGRFRYRGIDGDVFRSTALLMDTGADICTLYDKLYVDDVKVLKLQGYVLTHFKTTPHGVAYIHFTKRMMQKFGVNKNDAGNLVNSIGNIRGSLIWVAFIDQMNKKEAHPKNKLELAQNEIRVRLRSRNVAINDVASKYRGGGHLQAAGATIYSKKEMKNILNDLDQVLDIYKKEHPDAE